MISSSLEFFFFFVVNIEFGFAYHLAGAVVDWNFEGTRCIWDVIPLSTVSETMIKSLSSSYHHINGVPPGSVMCFEEKLYKAGVALKTVMIQNRLLVMVIS